MVLLCLQDSFSEKMVQLRFLLITFVVFPANVWLLVLLKREDFPRDVSYAEGLAPAAVTHPRK